ncbi:MAG: HAD hydrolase family protein [Oscillospiraceae bacterium]
MAAKGIPVTLDPDRPDFTFEKLVVFDLGQADMTRFQAEAGRDFTLIDRGGGMTEAVLLGNSKSTGIHRILDHYHLSREAAFAFGDSANDLPRCSNAVATPIAMGGSPPAVQQAAVYTTGTVLENGIQQGLRHFGPI